MRMIKIIFLTLILSILSGCVEESEQDEFPVEQQDYKVGTIFSPSIFTSAFTGEHSEVVDENYLYSYEPIEIGTLSLHTGKLVICEPLYFYDETPVEIELIPGNYPVYISEAIISEKGKVLDKRNAFVKIVLNSGRAVEWEYVWTFGADGGTGGYIDFGTVKEIVNTGASESFSNSLLKEFKEIQKIIEPFHQNYKSYQSYVNLKYGKGNLIAFSTGWGDGAYNSFLGKDKNGNPVEIITDLGISSWEPDKNLK